MQITFDNILKSLEYLNAEQMYFEVLHFPGEAVPSHFSHYSSCPRSWNEKQARDYHVYCEVEKLLKQIGRYRKIKGFKPAIQQIWNLIEGEIECESLLQATEP